jgi:HSP20 family protein
MNVLAKFEPVTDIEGLFDRFLGKTFTPWLVNKVPAIDVIDKKDRVVVKAEIPGIDKKDIDVTVDSDILTIKGETKKEKETEKENYYYCERAYGSFYRDVQLPAAVQKDKVKATYKDGILIVDLAKSEEEKSSKTKIEIQ